MRRLAWISAAFAALAALPLASMPLGLRTAAWSGDDDILEYMDGMALDDLVLTDETTLVLTNGVISARNVAVDGVPTIILSAIPSDGLLVPLSDGGESEAGMRLIVAGVAVAGYSLVEEPDGLYIRPANVAETGGKRFATLGGAFAAAQPGATVSLLRDHESKYRIDMSADCALDMAGHELTFCSRWAFNVGDASLAVMNGSVNCAEYGFYIVDGALAFENCGIVASCRVAQIRGAGVVDVAEDVRLETTGDDPVIFAVGGFNGCARVNSRGTLVQSSAAGGRDTTAYCVAGNPNDTFGAVYSLCGGSGTYFTDAADSCVHHPRGQGGKVAISGGWFSLKPRLDWIVRPLGARPEILDGWDGWRVLRIKGFTIRIR